MSATALLRRPAVHASAMALTLVVAAGGVILATSPAAAVSAPIEVLPDDIGATVGDTTTPWTKANADNVEGRYEIVEDPAEGTILELETVGGTLGIGSQSKFMHYFASGAYPSIDGSATVVGSDPTASIPLATLIADPISATYRAATYVTLQIEIRYGVDGFATIYQRSDGTPDWASFSIDPSALWTTSGALTDAVGDTIVACGATGSRVCINGENITLDNLLTGLAGQDPRAIAVGVNKGRDTQVASAGLVQVRDISFGGETFVFAVPPAPVEAEEPVGAPAPDAAGLGNFIADNDIDVETDTKQFVSEGPGATDLSSLSSTTPLEGRFEDWNGQDHFVDLYAYSTPVHLGTFPVVNGDVVLNGVDIAALDPGNHHLVFVGQGSGAVRVVAISIVGLAATGLEPAPGLASVAVLALLAGAIAVAASRARPAHR